MNIINIAIRTRQLVELLMTIACIWAIFTGVSGVWFWVSSITLAVLAINYSIALYYRYKYSDLCNAIQLVEEENPSVRAGS